MPGYNAHRIFNYAILIAFAALAWYESINPKHLLALGIGFYIGTDFLLNFNRFFRCKAMFAAVNM